MISRHLSSFIDSRYRRRRIWNLVSTTVIVFFSAFSIGVLFLIFGYVLFRGFPGLGTDLFLKLPTPVGEAGGGLSNAILGTSYLVGLAALLGVPWGVLSGIYLAEYGKGWLGSAIRFCADILSSVPSIVVGLFVYAILVIPMRRFSAIAGSFALAIMMVPTISRSTEELLRLVPQHIREAGLALGIPRWKVIIHVVLRGSLSGIVTGVMLAIARAAGETAPLLFTAFNNHYHQWRPDQPIASLPVIIYTYAISPFDDWHNKAWAGALVLVGLVFSLNLATRLLFRSKEKVY